MLNCPDCGNRLEALYLMPVQYNCKVCVARFVDANNPGIPVLSAEEGRRKRPGMYGDPVCDCCFHSPHPDSICVFCFPEIRRVRLAKVTDES